VAIINLYWLLAYLPAVVSVVVGGIYLIESDSGVVWKTGVAAAMAGAVRRLTDRDIP
jgi:hypothetical protein